MRGYQKRVVCLKKTDSPMIEEAYFVLSRDLELGNNKENFIKEANKLIEENTREKKKKDGRLLAFFAGFTVALAIAISLFLLTR